MCKIQALPIAGINAQTLLDSNGVGSSPKLANKEPHKCFSKPDFHLLALPQCGGLCIFSQTLKASGKAKSKSYEGIGSYVQSPLGYVKHENLR